MIQEMRRRQNEGVEPAAADDRAGDDDQPIDDMTIAELKDHAEGKGIDLGSATKKDDIIAAIKSATEA